MLQTSGSHTNIVTVSDAVALWSWRREKVCESLPAYQADHGSVFWSKA